MSETRPKKGKDIRSFFGASTSSTTASSSLHRDTESHSSSDSDEPGPPTKKACREKFRSVTSKRKYSKTWEKQFSWLVYDEDIDGAFCRVCKQTTSDSYTHHTGGVWVSKPFQNWKKA